MKSESFILVDGFDEGVLTYMLPIIAGYARAEEIPTIVFYKTNQMYLASLSFELNLTEKCSLQIRNYSNVDTLKIFAQRPSLALSLLFSMSKVLFASLFFDGNLNGAYKILASRYDRECFAGFWDLLNRTHGQGRVRFGLKKRLSVVNKVIRSMFIGHCAYTTECVSVWLGHNVYQLRAVAAAAICAHTPLFLHAAFCVNRIRSFDSPPPPEIMPETYSLALSQISELTIDQILVERFGENPTNMDLQRELVSRDSSNYESVPPGVVTIFLPVFGDSPFGWASEDRAFFDYGEWLSFVFETLNQAGLRMIFKIHPSSFLWGENPFDFLEAVGIVDDGKNICIDRGGRFDRQEIFENSKMIITYRGTSAYESCLFRKKPIVFERNSLSEYAPDSVYLIKNPNDFRDLLNPRAEFSVSEENVRKAGLLIYLRECCVGFREKLEATTVFRAESKETKRGQRSNLLRRVSSDLDLFLAIGSGFAGKSGYDQYHNMSREK